MTELPPIKPWKMLTREERQIARVTRKVLEAQMTEAALFAFYYQHEQLQQTINAVLARWANEMLADISAMEESPHDH